MSHLAERRIRIMTEVLTGIKTIKVNCWEQPFTTLVTAVRRYDAKIRYSQGVGIFTFYVSVFL